MKNKQGKKQSDESPEGRKTTERKREKTNKESGISWNSENDHWRRKEEHQIDLD